MKTKILLFLTLLAFTVPGMAQSIPNPSLENWTVGPFWANNPDGWSTNNDKLLYPVRQDSNSFSGDYALTAYEGGWAACKFGIAQVPSSVQFYAMSSLIASDSVELRVIAFTGTTATDSIRWVNSNSLNSWTMQSITVSNFPAGTDSLKIKVVGGTQTGSTLTVDEFSILMTGTIDKAEKKVAFRVFPNPMTSQANIILNNPAIKGPLYLRIFDLKGQMVRQTEIAKPANILIERSELKNGLYFFQLSQVGKNEILGTEKLLIR